MPVGDHERTIGQILPGPVVATGSEENLAPHAAGRAPAEFSEGKCWHRIRPGVDLALGNR